MIKNKIITYLALVGVAALASCKVPSWIGKKDQNQVAPKAFTNVASSDSTNNTAKIKHNDFFKDQNLRALIDTALKNNQELNIVMQEINSLRSEVIAKKGAYLPFVGVGPAVGFEKSSRYTRNGSVDDNENIAITPSGKPIPKVLPDFLLAVNVSWEIDIWKKLRNSKKSAMYKYLAGVEGKNFMITNLVAEVASSYYEIMALDNELDILQKYIQIQQDALDMVKMEKAYARSNELAVKRFTAEVLKNQSRLYYIHQQIIQTENHINFLIGRFPQPIQRNSTTFQTLNPDSIQTGSPSQLLQNRPDIRQSEKRMQAAKLDVKSAKAYFYPTLMLSASLGLDAFSPTYLLQAPMSMLYSLIGGLMTPVFNRNDIRAQYYAASARQSRAIFNYEKTMLNAYVEVSNSMANITNLKKTYDYKAKQVDALKQSITISINLFKSARTDYMDVLFTQRDALDAQMELIETKKKQMNAMVDAYRALGGGWK
ncbi:MAG: TolC family protein [Bacteroidetes bacterium]|nr:TolC family protein [Bacteroidota bacterium]